MSDIDRLEDLVVGRITFPLINSLYDRRNIHQCYKSLLDTDKSPEAFLQDLQLKRLRNVITHAFSLIPYYKNRLNANGITPEDITQLEDIKNLPTLSRQEIIDHYRDMVDVRYQSNIPTADKSKKGPGEPVFLPMLRKQKIIRNTSTGSTGSPIIFYEDGVKTALNWVHEMRLKRWYGLYPGVKEARMARVSADYLANSKILLMRKRLWHQLILPGMNFTDTIYEMCLSKIIEFQPRILFGITSALYGLADYIKRSQTTIENHHIDLVITWAAPLYNHEKSLLEEVFNCPVTNIYGSREVGHVAALCPHGSLHVNQENYLVEIEASSSASAMVEPGEILITSLFPSPMPFIRYRIGDIGEISSSDCPCGRSHQVLKQILGRSGEIYHMKDGRMISPNFWCRGFMGPLLSQSVERFQIIYHRDGVIRLRIVRKDNFTADAEAEIRQYIEKNFDSDIQYKLEYVPKIDPQPSGKFQLVVNELIQGGAEQV